MNTLETIPHVPYQQGQPGRGEVAIDEAVWNHFRRVTSVKTLGHAAGLRVEVITWPWDAEPRQRYVNGVAIAVRGLRGRKLVLLDPDNGIEPGTATPKHVKEDEVQDIWRALATDDWLVLYQHERRFVLDWRDVTKRQFEQACGGVEAEVFESPEIANDVVFFAAKQLKEGSE